MDNEELFFHVKRGFEKVKAEIKTHDAYIETLRAENQLLKMQIQQLMQMINANQNTGIKSASNKHYNKVFIKEKILEALSKGSIPVAELKEVIVDQNNYCSKASFYRYIEYLKKTGKLVLIETDGIAFVSTSLHATN